MADPQGYAKLVFKDRDFIVRVSNLVLGRSHKGLDPNNTGFFVLGDQKTLSRNHAQLQWDAQNGWQIECLSKNSIFVNESEVSEGTKAKLNDRDKISVGEIDFYFLLPITEKTIAAQVALTGSPLKSASSSSFAPLITDSTLTSSSSSSSSPSSSSSSSSISSSVLSSTSSNEAMSVDTSAAPSGTVVASSATPVDAMNDTQV